MTWKDYFDNYENWTEKTQYGRLAAVTDFGPETSPAEEIAQCVDYMDEKTACSLINRALRGGVIFTGRQVADFLRMNNLQDSATICRLLEANDGNFTAGELEEMLACAPENVPIEALIDKICSMPTHFDPDEAISLYDAMKDEEIAGRMLFSVDSVFTDAQINELCNREVDDVIIRKLSEQSGIPFANYDAEEEPEPEEEPEEKKDWSAGMGAAMNNFVDSLKCASTTLMERQPKKKSGGLGLGIALGLAGGSKKSGHNGRCTGDCANCPPHYGYRYGRWYYGHGHIEGCEFGGNGGCSGKCHRD